MVTAPTAIVDTYVLYSAPIRYLIVRIGQAGEVSTLTAWMRPVQRSAQVGAPLEGQGISPADRRSAIAASSELAYRSPAAAASGAISGWNTVAIGAAKSDRFELTSTREFGYRAAASRVLSWRAWPRM